MSITGLVSVAAGGELSASIQVTGPSPYAGLYCFHCEDQVLSPVFLGNVVEAFGSNGHNLLIRFGNDLSLASVEIIGGPSDAAPTGAFGVTARFVRDG